MQKLCSHKIIFSIVFFLLLFSCGKKSEERKEVILTRSVAISGEISLDWKLNPLYIDSALYQPTNIFELENEISNILEQEFFYSLRNYAIESSKVINISSCSHLSDQLTHFYEGYFEFMKGYNPNNSEYHIYGISWMTSNWNNIKRIQKKSPICKNGYLSEELYLYGLFYREAVKK